MRKSKPKHCDKLPHAVEHPRQVVRRNYEHEHGEEKARGVLAEEVDNAKHLKHSNKKEKRLIIATNQSFDHRSKNYISLIFFVLR